MVYIYSKKLKIIKICQLKAVQNDDLVFLQEKVVVQAVCLRIQVVSIKARF